MLDGFVRTYADRTYRFPVLVNHGGVVLGFAMDASRRIYYSVLDLAHATSNVDSAAWSANPTRLDFPTEIAPVGFAAADPTALPSVTAPSSTPGGAADPFLSSTARLTAAAAFSVVSDGRYLYIFRQGITDPSAEQLSAAQAVLADPTATPEQRVSASDVLIDRANVVYATVGGQPVLDAQGRPVPVASGRLLADRFLLVGTQLQPTLEVRYQRSRNKSRPASRTDGLGATDLDGLPFVEPTQELRLLPAGNLVGFTVLLVPTSVAEAYRWQIFTADHSRETLWSYSIERGADGWFDPQGSQVWTCTDHPDVSATTPGSCTRAAVADQTQQCGKILVPRVELSGAAGSALSLATPGSLVRLDGVATLGTTFTVEAWIRPVGQPAGEQRILGGDADDAHRAPTLSLIDGTKIALSFGDGSLVRSYVTDAVITTPGWHHVSVALAPTLVTVCVDGLPVATSPSLTGFAPVASAVTLLGAPAAGFTGTVDEVRLWNRARAVAEIRADLQLRLSGLEEGLVGYWRLDEGAGQTVYDQAGAATGSLDGPVWVTSDAPVGQSRGVARSALRIDGRVPAGGLSALLYYQQEYAPSGYENSQPKPQKGAARVMLAAVAATSADGGGQAGAGLIAALDFGIGQDGRLADLPTEVVLDPPLESASGAGGSTNDLLDRLAADETTIAQAESDIATTSRVIDELTDGIAAANAAAHDQPYPRPPTGAAADLLTPCVQAGNVFSVIAELVRGPLDSPALQNAQAALQPILLQLDDGIRRHTAQLTAETATLTLLQQKVAVAQADIATLRSQVNGDAPQPMPLVHIDGDGSTVVGAVLGFAPTGAAPALFASALGRVGLYFRGNQGQLSVAYYDTFTGHTQFSLPAGSSGTVTVLPRTTEDEFDALTLATSPGPTDDTCTLTIGLSAGPRPSTETWHNLPRDPQRLAGIVNGLPPAAIPVGLASSAHGRVKHLTLPAGTTAPITAGAAISAGTAVLVVATDADRGATTVAVEPTDVELRDGTPVAVIAYDYGQATTTLPGGSLERGSRLVVVDARGATGPIGDAQGTLLTSTPSARWYGAPPGTALEFDGKATVAGLLQSTALSFDGRQAAVSLGNPDALAVTGAVTLEAWVRPTTSAGLMDILGRGYVLDPAGEVVLRINQGNYQVGSWDGADHMVSTPVPAEDLDHWVHLAGVYDGSSWLLYRNGVLLAQHADPVGAVDVQAGWAIGASAAGDRFFHGGIDEARVWRRVRSPLEIADNFARRLDGTDAGLAGYWFFAEGGWRDQTAGHNDGTLRGAPTSVASPPALSTATDFDVTGDVTVEAWVNPAEANGLARIVAQRSPVSDYQVAVRAIPSALSFDGTSQFAHTGATTFDVSGRITVEAWVYPTDPNGLRYIVAHGLQTNPQREVALRINAGSYQFGCYDGNDHYAVATIPADDVGRWVHLAGAYDGTTWLLYRDGTLLSSKTDATGSIAVAAPWAVGASADGTRFFAGSIAEVRVWTLTRTADQIATFGRRWLTGTEDGLIACWRYDGTALRDVTPAQRPISMVKNPKPTSGPVPAFRAVAGAGARTVESTESFLGGHWSHLALAFRQDYALHLSGPADYLDAGNRSQLDIAGDLTLEVTVLLDDLSAPQGLLSRGALSDGSDQRVPYALAVQTDGSVQFSFEDTDGTVQTLGSNPGAVAARALQRIAVTRKRNVRVDTSSGNAVVDRWDEIAFTVEHGTPVSRIYTGKDAGSSTAPLLLGRGYAGDGTPWSLRGTLTEVRMWSKARDATSLGDPIAGSEAGLVSWWRLGEGSGNVAATARARVPPACAAALPGYAPPTRRLRPHGVPGWNRRIDPRHPAAGNAPDTDGFTIGGDSTASGQNRFTGSWKSCGSGGHPHPRADRRQPVPPAHRRAGRPGGLLHVRRRTRCPTHRPGPARQRPRSGRWRLFSCPRRRSPRTPPRSATRSPEWRPTTRLLSRERPGSRSTRTCSGDPTPAWPGSSSAVMHGRRRPAGGNSITGFKVGDLSVEWVGQAQFDPQLMGYIEGAPPVPSENLTVDADGYTGASSVTLTEATDTNTPTPAHGAAGWTPHSRCTANASGTSRPPTGRGGGRWRSRRHSGWASVRRSCCRRRSETDAGGRDSLSAETSPSWTRAARAAGHHADPGQRDGPERAPGTPRTPRQPGPRRPLAAREHGMALVQSQTADVFALRLRTPARSWRTRCGRTPTSPRTGTS